MTALERFQERGGHKEPIPLERLRFFCSLALDQQDWLDVEQFFDAVGAEIERLRTDCRTCIHYRHEYYRFTHCVSSLRCEDGNQYEATERIVLWEKRAAERPPPWTDGMRAPEPSDLIGGWTDQPPQAEGSKHACPRCVTPVKCGIYGCSPGTWPAEE